MFPLMCVFNSLHFINKIVISFIPFSCRYGLIVRIPWIKAILCTCYGRPLVEHSRTLYLFLFLFRGLLFSIQFPKIFLKKIFSISFIHICIFFYFQLSELEQRVLEAEGRAEEAEDKVSRVHCCTDGVVCGCRATRLSLSLSNVIDCVPSRRVDMASCSWQNHQRK